MAARGTFRPLGFDQIGAFLGPLLCLYGAFELLMELGLNSHSEQTALAAIAY